MWDLLFACLVVAAGWAGYRRGALGALATLVGIACGVLLGGPLAELLFPPTSMRDVVVGRSVGIVAVTVLVAAGLGLVASRIASSLPASTLGVDRALGATIRASMVGIGVTTLWTIVAGVPPEVLPPQVRSARDSAPITAWIAERTPVGALSRSAPRLVPIPSLQTPLAPAPITVASTRGVRRAARSVVRIEASGCPGRLDTGSGWVASSDRVVTAAHVVAGADRVTVDVSGRRRSARVVGVDAERDLALLAVRTGLPPLRVSHGRAGESGAVVGYPRGGPERRRPARVGSEARMWVPDYVGTGIGRRRVLSVRASVEPGDSGGPLLDADGAVIGLVFASGAADAAYALPSSELRPSPSDPETGECIETDPSELLG